LAIAYLVLSALDTLATSWFVARGVVSELNPVLRPLVAGHPFGFIVAKNLCSLAALFIPFRFHLVRAGRISLWANAGIYLLLDLYWLWLMVRTHLI
jgi:hypothetical protein